jgi:hypothetical protein
MDARDTGGTIVVCMASGQEGSLRRITAEPTNRELDPTPTRPPGRAPESAPPERRPSEWVLLTYVGTSQRVLHAPDRETLERFVAQRGYQEYELFRLDPRMRLDRHDVEDAPSPRQFSVVQLRWDHQALGRLTRAGCWTLGQVADLSYEQFLAAGFKPEHYHDLRHRLAEFGLEMSFGLLPGERKGRSPKRRKATTAA